MMSGGGIAGGIAHNSPYADERYDKGSQHVHRTESELDHPQGSRRASGAGVGMLKRSLTNLKTVFEDNTDHCNDCPYPTNNYRVLTRYQRKRYDTHMLLEDPNSGKWARLVNFLVLWFICISTLSVAIETVPDIQIPQLTFDIIEIFCVMLFSIEFALRLWSSKRRFKFFINMFNILDLLAIIPWYIQVIFTVEDQVFISILRVCRCLRIFQAIRLMDMRHTKSIGIITESIRKSSDALGLLVFLLSLITIISSSMCYFAEKGIYDADQDAYIRSDGSISPFTSIPKTCYWAVVTMTTVGYGDIAPIEDWGKFIASLTALSGILIIAMPITILGTNFQETFYLRNHRKPSQTDQSHGDDLITQHIYAIRYHRKQLDYSLSSVRIHLEERAGSTEIKSTWSTIETVIVSGLYRIEKFLTLQNEHRLPPPDEPLTMEALGDMISEYEKADLDIAKLKKIEEKAHLKRSMSMLDKNDIGAFETYFNDNPYAHIDDS